MSKRHTSPSTSSPESKTADPAYFDRLSIGGLGSEEETLEQFLLLTRDDVEVVVERTMRKSMFDRTWVGLLATLERNGYSRVRELGVPAATSWASNLGLIPRKQNALRQIGEHASE